jgi:hypothetical protein
VTIFILAATMDDAKQFCQQRRIERDAKLVNKPEDWPEALRPQDYVCPLTSFFTLPNWREIYGRMPHGQS